MDKESSKESKSEALNRAVEDLRAYNDPDRDAERRMRLGAFVRDRRDELGLTQTDLAERSELSRSFVNAIERGKIGTPSADKRRQLADALGVRHIDLLVAAGELDEREVRSVAPRPRRAYPQLMNRIEQLTPDVAHLLEQWLDVMDAGHPRPRRARSSAGESDTESDQESERAA